MSGKIVLKGTTSGQVELTVPAVAGNNTLTLPATTGNFVTASATGDVSVSGDLTVTGDVTVTGNLSGGKDYYSIYANADQTDISSDTKVNYNTVHKNSNASVFVNSGGTITINKTGTFMITADVSTYVSSSTTARSNSNAVIQKNSSTIAGTTMWMYNREGPDSNEGHNTGSSSIILDITSGDTIQVTAKRYSGTDTVGLRRNGSRLTIVEL